MINKFKKGLKGLPKYGFLSIAAFFSLFPFYWMIVSATNKTVDITKGKMTFGSELFNNYNRLIKITDIGVPFMNTVKVTVIYTVLALSVCSIAAYGFEKFKSKGKEKIYAIFIFSMMIPFGALMIPLFKMVVSLNLVNNHWAIILPYVGQVFLIFYFRQSFKFFPNEIIEAARIDGAGEISIFLRVVVPSMKSTFASASIFAFTLQWNNFLWPLIVLQTDKMKTMTLVISSLSSAYFVDYGILMLAIVIATLPMVLLFMTMQKHFVEGMVGSAK
ncbi:carbohydrate ABC transporter permease [Clostridium sp.]|jgi:lactose/L-arabinose transport system permease protein|uniref:carbohydrate ABC transporter permease n=1 Tax=Clostridium sp. TaxID=1506 RepID=UPI003EED5CDC